MPEIKFAAFDIETEGIDGAFVSGAVVSKDRIGFYDNLPSLVMSLRELALSKHTLIAHNAEYDIMASLWPAGENVTLHYYESTFNRATWRLPGRGKTAEIWDSMNLCAGLSLQRLGEAIGLAKYSTPSRLTGKLVDHYAWKCDTHLAWECIECYNLRDAEIVYRFASQFADWLQSQQLRMKRTLGGNAVAIWQAYDSDQQQPLRAPLIKELARDAYFAGRSEVFKPGYHEVVYTADIASAYLYLMQTVPMPDMDGLTYVRDPKRLELDGLHGVIEATVTVPRMYVPPLPLRMPDGHVIYPIGHFTGSWVIEELRQAVNRGVIIERIHRAAFTRKSVYPFANFTGGLYQVRKEFEARKDARAFQVKTLANSLPGRLGIREEQRYRAYTVGNGRLTDAQVRGRDVQHIGKVPVLVEERQIRMLSSVSNVLWAATICAYGRVRLLQELEGAGYGLIYCDTDSVFATNPLVTASGDLGELRDTGRYVRGQFYGQKLYRIESDDSENIAIARGIPKQMAMEFLKSGAVSFNAPNGLIVGIREHTDPRHWQTLTRTRRAEFAGRTLMDPRAVRHGLAWSDTLPLSAWDGSDGPEVGRTALNASR